MKSCRIVETNKDLVFFRETGPTKDSCLLTSTGLYFRLLRDPFGIFRRLSGLWNIPALVKIQVITVKFLNIKEKRT